MSPLLDTLRWQFRMTWSLANEFWLPALTDELLVWSQAPMAASMRQDDAGRWSPDWDDGDTPVPATAGWLTWHITWWWSSIFAALDSNPVPPRQSVSWSPDASAVREQLGALAGAWQARLDVMTDDDLEVAHRFPWPEPRAARLAVAWVNSELMKNVAELGDVVRLHGALNS